MEIQNVLDSEVREYLHHINKYHIKLNGFNTLSISNVVFFKQFLLLNSGDSDTEIKYSFNWNIDCHH